MSEGARREACPFAAVASGTEPAPYVPESMERVSASRSSSSRPVWRSRTARAALFCISLLAFSSAATALPQGGDSDPDPLLRAHAHNDYLHARPLHDALEHGFNSVEVDVHLVGDELLVAHDREEVDPTRTLESLYLAPLRARVAGRDGAVYPGAPPLLLLIDIKSGAEDTYARLHPLLRSYADILTFTVGDIVVEGPVQAVISGNRPKTALLAAPVRFAAYDGRLSDLEENASLPPSFMPLISDSWDQVTDWNGEGPPPSELRARLEELAALAHSQGRRIRFWGAPDRPEVWELLHETGVDLINSDDLEGLSQFLSEREDREDEG